MGKFQGVDGFRGTLREGESWRRTKTSSIKKGRRVKDDSSLKPPNQIKKFCLFTADWFYFFRRIFDR